jgi:peptide chain release factor 1
MEWMEQLSEIEARYEEVFSLLSDPAVIKEPHRLAELTKESKRLEEIVSVYRCYKYCLKEIEDSRALLQEPDEELKRMAKEELEAQQVEAEKLEAALKSLLVPRNPDDERGVVLEIRAGTGGEEAALFAADLARMYLRFAEINGWKTEVLSSSETGTGGYKEIILGIQGTNVYGSLKHESGVHRVQRVPITEASGRIHTSTATVAVLSEAEEVEVQLSPDELRVDVFRSSGPGGQSVNTTDSAVRMTHLPTGIVVSCQDEKSQIKNKAKAMKILRSRLKDLAIRRQHEEISENRRKQVGTAERSERIRTYNFPQGRVTDHRINLTVFNLQEVLEGNLEPFVRALQEHYQAFALVEGAHKAAIL